jgi:hypothetical protein
MILFYFIIIDIDIILSDVQHHSYYIKVLTEIFTFFNFWLLFLYSYIANLSVCLASFTFGTCSNAR